jgi:hypothetical protein
VKVGDLVCPYPRHNRAPNWIGVVTASGYSCVVVYWNDKYPHEVENKEDLEVINESR